MSSITIPYGYEPRHYQENILKALDDGIKNACWIVHRRGGKDTTMWNYMIKRAYLEPGQYFYFLPTFAQAKKVIWDGMTNNGRRMLDYIPKEIIIGNPNNTEMKIWINGAYGQSLIQLIGGDSYDNVMGTNPRGVVFSEWPLMDPMAYEYIKPILAANGGWAAFVYTPRGKGNHGWDLAEIARRNPEEWFFEILTVRDTGVLTEEQIEAERRKGMPEDLIQQEFYCNFDRGQEGSYYGRQIDELRKKGQITRVSYDPAVPVRTYWDLGIGDSTAIWFAQFVGKEVHLINYYENSGEGLAHYARILDEFRRETGCVYDLSIAPHDIQARELTTGVTRLETARRLGLTFRVAPKLSLESGIEAVRMILSRCWFDEKRCEHGLKCLENYRKQYNEKFRVYGDKPFHDYTSHGCLHESALVSTSDGLKKIKDINVGDFVITPLGKRKVLWAGKTKETSELMEVITSRGNKLVCTKEHKIFVEGKGFMRCDTLRYNDVLSGVNKSVKWKILHRLLGMGSDIGFKESFGYPKTKKESCLMDISTDGMVFTTGGAALKASIPIARYIGLYGHFIKGKFLKVITCTTKIMMGGTTPLTTSNCTMPPNIQPIMERTTGGLEVQTTLDSLKNVMKKQSSGINLKKVESGIADTAKKHGRRENQLVRVVSYVRNLMKLTTLIGRNSAQHHAKANIIENITSRKKSVIALCVETFSKFMNILLPERVVSLALVQCQTTQNVYDLTVEFDKCYYANGLLVSNSDAFRMLAITESQFRPDRGVDDNDYDRMRQTWGWKI